MKWIVEFHPVFEPEFDALEEDVQDEINALGHVLEKFGPSLGRPWVDTLKDSKHANLKELRFDAAKGVWRVAFAFDMERKAMLLVAGDKKGADQKKFYKDLIKTADARFEAHQAELEKKKKGKKK